MEEVVSGPGLGAKVVEATIPTVEAGPSELPLRPQLPATEKTKSSVPKVKLRREVLTFKLQSGRRFISAPKVQRCAYLPLGGPR